MDENILRDYIKKYKGDYSKDSLKKQVVNNGFSEQEFDRIYDEISSESIQNDSIFPEDKSQANSMSSSNVQNKKGKSGLALTLVLLGLFVPLLGIIMIIIGIVLGFKARKINPQDGMALAAIIIGFIVLILAFIVVPIIAVVAFQVWFNTYQSGLNAKIERQVSTGSSITFERLEVINSSANIYLKNSGYQEISGVTVKVSAKSSDIPDPNCVDGLTSLAPTGISTVTLDCSGGLTSGEIYNVVAVTPEGVFSGEQIAR